MDLGDIPRPKRPKYAYHQGRRHIPGPIPLDEESGEAVEADFGAVLEPFVEPLPKYAPLTNSSTSVPTHTCPYAPSLPVELWDMVAKELIVQPDGGMAAIKQLSLVCRIFANLCRRFKFNTLTIQTLKQCVNLITMGGSPNILPLSMYGPLVVNFSISIMNEAPIAQPGHSMGRLLDYHLKRMRPTKVSILATLPPIFFVPIPWRNIDSGLVNTLTSYVLPTACSLSIRGISFSPNELFKIVSTMRNLSVLAIYTEQLIVDDPQLDITEEALAAEQMIAILKSAKLSSLSLNLGLRLLQGDEGVQRVHVDPTLAGSLLLGLTTSNLRSLELREHGRFKLDHLMWLNKALHGSRLERLKIDIFGWNDSECLGVLM